MNKKIFLWVDELLDFERGIIVQEILVGSKLKTIDGLSVVVDSISISNNKGSYDVTFRAVDELTWMMRKEYIIIHGQITPVQEIISSLENQGFKVTLKGE